MKKLSHYFDKIFIIGALGSQKVNHTIESLIKLGLYDNNVIVYYYPHLDKIKPSIGIKTNTIYHHTTSDWNVNINTLPPDRTSLAISHYNIIKHAYNAGLKNVLILEDDNSFLKDISKWDKVLSTMPDDWDVMKFTGFKFDFSNSGYGHPIDFSKNKELIYNDIFRKISPDIDNQEWWAWGVSAVAYNRKAMELYITNQEKCFNLADWIDGIYNFEVEPCGVTIYMPLVSLFIAINDIRYTYKCENYIKFKDKDYI